MISLGEFLIVMPTIPQSIQTFFNDHQARLAAVSAAPGVVGLSLDLDQISATYLSKEIQILVRPKYSAHSNAGTTPEDKISRLASSVSRLANQVRPLAPNDAFSGAFTTGSVAAFHKAPAILNPRNFPQSVVNPPITSGTPQAKPTFAICPSSHPK
jgi:hypothetical protein